MTLPVRVLAVLLQALRRRAAGIFPPRLPRLGLGAGLLTREFSIPEAAFLLMASFFLSAALGAVRQVLFNAEFGAGAEAEMHAGVRRRCVPHGRRHRAHLISDDDAGADAIERALAISADPERAEGIFRTALGVSPQNERLLRLFERFAREHQRPRCLVDALVGLAKAEGIAVILAGHVTKDGDVAGPRTLEHAVDVVLTFDGEPRSGLRMVSGGIRLASSVMNIVPEASIQL